jgi:hypothetical protein
VRSVVVMAPRFSLGIRTLPSACAVHHQ